jgi:hypothetical protein
VSKHTDPIGTRRLLVGALSWIALAAAWWAVLQRDSRTWVPELLVPAVALVVVTALTLLWVRHNLGIFQRKGPRTGLPETHAPWERDSLGRHLDLPVAALSARQVTLVLDGDVKRYEVQA